MDAQPKTSHYSAFGGLWTDRDDAGRELERRLAEGRVSKEQAVLLEHWMQTGYVILPGAVPPDVCDEVRTDIENGWERSDQRLRVFPPGSRVPVRLSPDVPKDRMRIVDMYVLVESARRALFSPAIVDFLTLVFERPPLLFQSLSFEKGSQQGMHQDTAYVVTSSPLELAAAWIALQDVTEGSGELMYYEGSHRLPEYRFSDQFKHWSPERDGQEQHEEWANGIETKAAALGLHRRTFLPRKGDVLIWAADLAHGGSPVSNSEATRKSLVGHYCPLGIEPNYYSYAPNRRQSRPYGQGFYSSEYFDIGLDAATRDWRSGPQWFEEHYRQAADQVIDFLGGDGLVLTDRDVADVGCGDGIVDLGVFNRARPRSLVGFDLREVNEDALAGIAESNDLPRVIPKGLSFQQCGPTTLPAADDAFDVVFSWSAFEHIIDPVAVLREIRRVLRPDGVLMVQLWPFFASQHGSHLWEWSSEGFAQSIEGKQAAVEEQVRQDLADDIEWADARIEESRTLNRITLDELNRAMLAGGFYVSKLELMTNAFHMPRELARFRLSSLAIAGAKLLANPL
jgi:phytanoyl-CoA hydroxylase